MVITRTSASTRTARQIDIASDMSAPSPAISCAEGSLWAAMITRPTRAIAKIPKSEPRQRVRLDLIRIRNMNIRRQKSWAISYNL